MANYLEEDFIAFVKSNVLFEPDEPVIVGLSGGKDSMVLVSLLNKFDYPVIAAHCNFHLRGNESDKDQQFVEDWCNQNQIKLQVKHFDTKSRAGEQKVSVEMAARDLRYAWFRELLVSEKAQSIAVGHHLNDQVETLLMNLTRGTGFRGLTGMKASENLIVRPLLFATRDDIDQYATHENIPCREDLSNADISIKRNFFRHEVIPRLSQINPSFLQTTEANIKRFHGISRFLDKCFLRMENRLVTQKESGFNVTIPHGAERDIFVDFIHYLLEKYQIQGSITAVTDLLDAQVGSQGYIGAYRIIKERDALTFIEPSEVDLETKIVDQIPSERKFGQFHLRFTMIENPDEFNLPRQKEKVWVSANQIQWPIVIRRWRPGDRMHPLGMEGSRKIKKMLTDAKIESANRGTYPVISDQAEILWLPFVSISEKYAVNETTDKVIQIEALHN